MRRKELESSIETPSQRDVYEVPATNWSVLGAIILLLSGILVITGVFLPWISGSVEIFGINISGDTSGWDILSLAGIGKTPGVLLVVIGASLMIICAWLSFLLAITSGRKSLVRYLFIFSIIIALLIVGGASEFFGKVISEDYLAFVGYGFYISSGAALIGLIIGIIAYVRTQFRVVNFKQIH